MTRRIGVDTGGTFTDSILVDDETHSVQISKVPSRPESPQEAIASGIEQLVGAGEAAPGSLESVIHGTTIATNALLTDNLARVGFITTAGFRDVLEIGTQMRPKLYDLNQVPPTPLVPRDVRIEVGGRTAADGTEVEDYDLEEIGEAVEELLEKGVDAIAIGFLFSFLHPDREREAEALINERHPDVYAGASSRLSSEPREFSRFATAAVNAGLAPRVGPYVAALDAWVRERLGGARLYLMHSNGGLGPPERSADEGAHQLILSGPAAGVIGGAQEATASGFADCITLDVGGTSADIAMVRDGRPRTAIGMDLPNGLPCDLPHIEIETIGAGGGSIASLDAGGALTVGPQSAGADPGPACYGRGGTLPTVTDAQLVLGRLSPDGLIGGDLALDMELARAAIATIAQPLGLEIEAAALGVIAILEQNMIGGIQAAAARHGDDVREFALVAGGGAGPMHAVGLAAALDVEAVVIPVRPGLLSALGLLGANVRHDGGASLLSVEAERSIEDVWTTLDAIVARLDNALDEEGVEDSDRRFERSLDLRYVGQEYSLRVPLEGRDEDFESVIGRFHDQHERTYGHSSTAASVEPVAARVVALGVREPVSTRPPFPVEAAVAQATRSVLFAQGEGWVETPVFDRDQLALGQRIEGPAIIEQFDSTTVLAPGWSAVAHESRCLVLERGAGA